MHTNITLSKPAKDHTWEEEHEVLRQVKEILAIEWLTQGRGKFPDTFRVHKINQEMRRLGFK